ncbi:MAG: hypothetical protein JWM86_242 [Thermoleophilia bacterium]|nr:hypothetical protein [Thermoleophilia bacterium]
MDEAAINERLVTHIQQAHAMERAQLGELRALASEVELASVRGLLERHHEATEEHARLLEARLGELDASGSLRLLTQSIVASLPKLVMDRVRPDSERAILRDAIIAEAMEYAAYLLLEAEAIRCGDEDTALLAQTLRQAERDMRDELMTFWNQAVDHDIDRIAGDGDGPSRTRAAREMLIDHLRDVHALERNAVIMLSTVLATVEDELATERVTDHRDATERHAEAISERLGELGSGPSMRKQAQGYAFAAVKGPVNLVRAERAAKDLRDMYVVEHMELVAYRQLEVLADRAGDERTASIALAHMDEEAAMALWLERETARFLLETMAKQG